MQVRVCPKCAFENGPATVACLNCNTRLVGLPLMEREQTESAAAQSATGQNQSSSREPGQPQAATSPPVPPSLRQRYDSVIKQPPPEPVKERFNPLPLVLLLVVIVAGAVIAFTLQKPPKQPTVPPDTVVISFLEAKKTNNFSKVEPYLSKASVEKIRGIFSNRQAESAGFNQHDVEKMLLFDLPPQAEELKGSEIRTTLIQDKEAEKNTATVRATILSATILGQIELEFDYVLVIEDGEWKVDLERSSKFQSNQMLKSLLDGRVPGQ